MINNLLYIRQFTAENSCSVEFYTSGLTVKDPASGHPLLRCDSTGPFTPFICRLLLLHLRPPRQLPLSRHNFPPPGTVTLVIPTATFWLNLDIVQMSLVLGLLLSIFVMRANWVIMFDFDFLLRMGRMLLILYIVNVDIPTFLAISIILW
jgi:hypothetical protein